MRNHLSAHHPTGVPFASMSLSGGRKSVAYFCQGLNRKCPFVSNTGSEMLSHIKHCYFGMLDGFSNCTDNAKLDHGFVISSLGIASKLTNSGPSTYLCLRCDCKSQNLEPLLTHVRAYHDNSIAGVLHVSIRGDNSKHTQVCMMCVVCKLPVSVDQWKSHLCRSLELDHIKEENVEGTNEDEMIPQTENFENSLKREIEQDMTPNEDQDDCDPDGCESTNNPAEMPGSEKRNVEKDNAHFDFKSKSLPTFSKLLTVLTTNEALPKRDNVQVDGGPSDGECLPNFGKLLAPVISATKEAPVKTTVLMEKIQPGTEDLPNFSKLLTPEKKCIAASDIVTKASLEKDKQMNEGFVQNSENHAKNSSEAEASTSLDTSSPQSQEKKAMCVISNCFSMTAPEKQLNSAKIDDPNAIFNSSDVLSIQNPRPARSLGHASSRSVLHGLLSSQSQTAVTSSNALSLLQNLLTSPNTLTSGSGLRETFSSEIRQGSQRVLHGCSQPSVPLPLPSIRKHFVKKDYKTRNLKQQGDNKSDIHKRKVALPVSTPQVVKEVTKADDSSKIIPNSPELEQKVMFLKLPQKVQKSNIKKANIPEILTIEIPSTSKTSSEEGVHRHGITTDLQALSPPAKIPTPPQLPSHLQPLSPVPEATPSPVQVTPSASHTASSLDVEKSCSPAGTSLLPTSEPGPLSAQSSPFTNLLRDLLCKSKNEEGKK